jgi:hypothetical protein
LLAGRDFTERDGRAAPKVTVISQEFARHFFPDGHAMGRNVYFGKDHESYQVIGIAEDVRNDLRRQAPRRFYVAEAQQYYEYYTIRYLVRTAADPARVMGRLRAVAAAENAALRVEAIDTADRLLDRVLDRDRLIAALSFAFGILAVTLAAVGVYGMLAYDVTRRTGEIGIRMALGATRSSVLALVFREVARVGTAGVALGLTGALALGRLVEGLVFELKPGDPRVLAGAVAVLVLVAIAAALGPARRAASMDPMRALRSE